MLFLIVFAYYLLIFVPVYLTIRNEADFNIIEKTGQPTMCGGDSPFEESNYSQYIT
jgi:hypothetical protein